MISEKRDLIETLSRGKRADWDKFSVLLSRFEWDEHFNRAREHNEELARIAACVIWNRMEVSSSKGE